MILIVFQMVLFFVIDSEGAFVQENMIFVNKCKSLGFVQMIPLRWF
jgi:hypothetical protein